MLQPYQTIVYVTAAPAETNAVLAGLNAAIAVRRGVLETPARRRHVLETGIGKSNAAIAIASHMRELKDALVINLGFAGTLDQGQANLGAAVLASPSMFGDEGVCTPDGFLECEAIGFPIVGSDLPESLAPAPEVTLMLRGLVEVSAPVLTVSTCAGSDWLARDRLGRGGGPRPVAEAMEGAAIGLACLRFGVRFAELRVISNTTGDRSGQIWDIPAACARLSTLVASIESAAQE